MCSDRLILLYSFILALNIGLSLTSALVCCVLHAQMKSKVPLLMFAPSQEAGVSTISVCLDKDPEYLKDRNPRFYQVSINQQVIGRKADGTVTRILPVIPHTFRL